MPREPGDPLRRIAELVADRLSEDGYAFVEDDQLDLLSEMLRSFLIAAGIPVHPSSPVAA